MVVIAQIAIVRESFALMALLLIGLSFGSGYLITRLVEIGSDYDSVRYQGVRNGLAKFEALTLILALSTYVFALLSLSNFGKGLKEQRIFFKAKDNAPQSRWEIVMEKKINPQFIVVWHNIRSIYMLSLCILSILM
jgi:hypothetical protein